jgi:hypothetical protein
MILFARERTSWYILLPYMPKRSGCHFSDTKTMRHAFGTILGLAAPNLTQKFPV